MPFAHCRDLKKDCSVSPHPQPFSQWEKGERLKSVFSDCYNDAMPYKYLFFDDYSEGAHPRILEALARTNLQQEPGYVMDAFAVQAAGFIRERFGCPQAEAHFVSSGTQANLQSYQLS